MCNDGTDTCTATVTHAGSRKRTRFRSRTGVPMPMTVTVRRTDMPGVPIVWQVVRSRPFPQRRNPHDVWVVLNAVNHGRMIQK
jgi:hypothetical protein